MSQNHTIDFNNHKIRCTLYNDAWWFVISDVIAAVTDSTQPSNYIKDMKKRVPSFKEGWGQFATPLRIKTVGGSQDVGCANLDGIFNLIKLTKSNKITQFKNFLINNPLFFEAELADLKIKYSFAPSFDLHKELIHLPTSLALYPRFLRLSKKRKELLELSASLKTIQKTLKKISAETKISLNQLECSIHQAVDNNWSINETEKYLAMAYQRTLQLLENTPKDSGGRPFKSITLHIVFRLVDIYFRGTTNKPKCGWDYVNDTHVGEFYNFVIELLPFLKKRLNLALSKPTTIGTYCREAIEHYDQILGECHQ